jgi:hypothetical protein
MNVVCDDIERQREQHSLGAVIDTWERVSRDDNAD